MIFDTILSLFYGMVTFFVGLLPVWSPWDLTSIATQIAAPATYGATPGGFSMNSIWHWLPWMNHYVPISEALQLLTLVATIYVAVLTAKFILWVLNVTHISGTS